MCWHHQLRVGLEIMQTALSCVSSFSSGAWRSSLVGQVSQAGFCFFSTRGLRNTRPSPAMAFGVLNVRPQHPVKTRGASTLELGFSAACPTRPVALLQAKQSLYSTQNVTNCSRGPRTLPQRPNRSATWTTCR